MRKILVVLIAALGINATSCATMVVNGVSRHVVMIQRGVVVTIINQCTPDARIIRAGDGEVLTSLKYGDYATLPLIPTPLSGDRNVQVIFQGYSADGRSLLGTAVRQFYVNSDGTHSETWIIGGGGSIGSTGLYNSSGRDVCRQ